jgi:Secretion system C-terminal sorting domain
MRQILYAVCFLFFAPTLNAQVITTYAGDGSAGFSGDGGPATAAEISVPQQIATDDTGNLYIADYVNYCIRKVSKATGIITTVAGIGHYGSISDTGGDGGPATDATFVSPSGVAVDKHHNIFIADGNRIRKVTASTGIITVIAGTGATVDSGDGGPATAAGIAGPTFLCVDKIGNLYIQEWVSVIRKIDTSGVITKVAGIADTTSFSGDGGPATAATFSAYGICTDTANNLYIADLFNERVRKITVSTGIISTVAGTGTYGFSGDGGAATAAELNQPYDVHVDDSGNIFISDEGNGRIREVRAATGIIYTVAGNGGIASYCCDDSLATHAEISPFSLAIDTFGNLYMADFYGSRVRKITFGDSRPLFTAGDTQHVNLCSGGVAGLDSALTIFDVDSGQREVWSAVKAPAHGALYVADTIYSTGGRIAPAGLRYVPDSGFLGTDTFSVRISDSVLADTAHFFVAVFTTPHSGTITGSSSVCAGRSITLADTVSGGTWDASGSVASVSGGVVLGISAGTETITYSVTNSCGTASTSSSVTVMPLPPAGAISGASSVCVGSSATLSDTVAGGTWSATGGAASVSAGVVHGVSAGTETITYTTTNSCGSASAMAMVTVKPLPHAGIITGAATVCAGASTTLMDTAAGGAWSAAGGAASVSGGVVHGTGGGTETITYTVTNSCGAASATHAVTVLPLPHPGPITGPSSVCVGANITLTDTTASGTWGSVGGAASVSGGVVHGVGAGTETITYTVTNSCGAASSSSAVTVIPPPNAGAITGPASVCEGSSITLADTATGGTWSTAGSTATVSDGVVHGISAGTDNITYYVINSCGTALASHRVTIIAVNAGTISGKDSVCEGETDTLYESTTGGIWATNAYGLITPLGTSASLAGITPGFDTVTYSVSASGCAGVAMYTVKVLSKGRCDTLLGVAEVSTATGFNVYPNPAGQKLTVEATGALSLYNAIGQEIYAGFVAQTRTVDVSKLPQGVYLVRVTNDGLSEVKRVVIER